MRKRIHHFEKISTTAVKLQITGNNNDLLDSKIKGTGRVYEIRVY